MSDTLFGRLASTLEEILSPARKAVEDPWWLDRLLEAVGGVPENVDGAALTAALGPVVTLADEIAALVDSPSPSFDQIASVLESATQAFDAIRALGSAGGPVAQLETLATDLVEFLVGRYFAENHVALVRLAVLLTLIQSADETPRTPAVVKDGQAVRMPFAIDRYRLDRLPGLLRDPLLVLRTEYLNDLSTAADASAMADKLFGRVSRLLSTLGVSWRYGIADLDRSLYGDAASWLDHSLTVYCDQKALGADADAGVTLALSPAESGDLGLVVIPFGSLTFTRQVNDWTLDLSLSANVQAFAYGRGGFSVLADVATSEVSGSFKATLPQPEDGPALLIGSTDGTRLEIGGASVAADVTMSADATKVALAANVAQSALVIAPGDGDGFLASLLPSDGLRANFDLGLGWSSESGLTFHGSAGLDATLPVGLSVGGVTLSGVHLGLQAHDDRVSAEISANVEASIGPVSASLERVGLNSDLSFPSSGGNIGVGELAFRFKPPSGVGLSLDVQGVLTGGGFLSHDPAAGTYAGAMQLSLHDELTLNAYGLVATKFPDGHRGYSLLVFITAEGFKPIPLGFGFKLERIGGMVGVHRTFDQDAIKAGLQSDSLATLLFPHDPVANAPALMQALATAFPPHQGSFLLGLLARITWFTPTLVQLDLALIQELGARTRLLVLGRISALLPSHDNDLIRINVDALGVLDFDEGTLSADAVLVDSRIAHRFPVTGSAALRARWPGSSGGSPGQSNFVLAVGGLNPRFTPPTGFPSLERVAIALTSGKNPRLVCDAYFAVTANTVQFGARASLYAEALGFSVTGDLGFDALVTILPPHFLVDFHASVQLKYHSHNLFKVSLDGTLEGPIPLRIAAKAKFEVFWISYTVHFNFTLADGDAAQAALPAVALDQELIKALIDPTNWTTRRAPGIAHGVALRSLPTSAGLVLDPLGQLAVQQQVVPLNLTREVETYGGAPVAGPRTFNVSGTLDGQSGAALQGAFAPARYFDLSDDEKLAAPSFEAMDSGLVLGDSAASFDAPSTVPAQLQYESIVLNPPDTGSGTPPPPPPSTVYTMPLDALRALRASGAAARVPARRVGRTRFHNPSASPAATLSPVRWRIVQAMDGAVAPPGTGGGTWSEHCAALDSMNRGGARWLMVPAHELPAQ